MLLLRLARLINLIRIIRLIRPLARRRLSLSLLRVSNIIMFTLSTSSVSRYIERSYLTTSI